MCVFFSNSGEEKINSFIVVVSSLKFLIEEQISSMKASKGTENVVIVKEFEVPPANFILHLTALNKVNKFSNLKVNDSHGQGSFSSRIVCITYFRFVSLLI